MCYSIVPNYATPLANDTMIYLRSTDPSLNMTVCLDFSVAQ